MEGDGRGMWGAGCLRGKWRCYFSIFDTHHPPAGHAACGSPIASVSSQNACMGEGGTCEYLHSCHCEKSEKKDLLCNDGHFSPRGGREGGGGVTDRHEINPASSLR